MSKDYKEDMKLINLNDYEYCSNKYKHELLVSKYLYILINLAEYDWISFEVWKSWYHLKLFINNKIRYVFWISFWFSNYWLDRTFKDKDYTLEILGLNWFKIPESCFVYLPSYDLKEIYKFIEKVWFPIILKPNDLSCWKGVYKIFNFEKFNEIFEKIKIEKISSRYVIQKHIKWKEYRLVYLDWEILLSYEKKIREIHWDWTSTIFDLVKLNSKNETLFNRSIEYLTSMWIDVNKNSKVWEKIQLLPVSNIRSWWVLEKIEVWTNELIFLREISNIFGADYFWIDIISDWEINNWYIIEINSTPSFNWYFLEYWHEVDFFYNKIWTYLKNN